MRTKLISINNLIVPEALNEVEDYLCFELYKQQQRDKEVEKYYDFQRKALIKLVQYVIENELTPAQRQAVILVKVNRLKQTEASKMIGINKSTINRNLQAAQNKFNQAFAHYECVKDAVLRNENLY